MRMKPAEGPGALTLLISHDPRFVGIKICGHQVCSMQEVRTVHVCLRWVADKEAESGQLQHCLQARLPMQLHALVIQFLTLTRMPSGCCHESKAMLLMLCRRESLQPLGPYLTRMQR